MKIGILTFHRSINNGAFMQCYSLCKKLQADFPQHEISVIDYGMPKVDEALYPATLKQYIAGAATPKRKVHLALNLLKDPGILRRQREKNAAFASAVKQLPLSQKKIYSNDTKELFEYIDKSFDVVISGSDAVWNYTLRGFPNPYFLDEGIGAAKLSYAASCFGMNYEKIPESEAKKIKTIFDSYRFLGVRDSESEKFAKMTGTSVSPVHTCDPTVFLNVNELPVDKKLLERKLLDAGYDFDRETLCVMGDDKLCSMVKEKFGRDYQIVSLFNYSKYADVNLYGINPFEWASVFGLFRLTFTTYFHGTLLSLRNGTPAAVLALDTEYTRNHISKTLDFLTRVGLEKWYFTDIMSLGAGAEEILKKDRKEEIISAMNKEAESYNVFKECLKGILEE